MDDLTTFTQLTFDSLSAFGQKLMNGLPNIFGAIILILLGWLIAKIIYWMVNKTLKTMRFDKLAEADNIKGFLEKAKITLRPSQLVAKFIYWIVMLLFLITASETLGWVVVSNSISQIIAYLPELFSAIVIFLVGLYIANFVRKALTSIFDSLSFYPGKIISSLAFYIILILISIMALNQAGIDTQVVTSNVILIIGAVLLSFAISFGFASREIVSNILSGYYSKNNFKVGQTIVIGDLEGKLERIDGISFTLKTKDGHMVIPAKKLASEDVKILDETK